jgi:hypothetical protein
MLGETEFYTLNSSEKPHKKPRIKDLCFKSWRLQSKKSQEALGLLQLI